jgi:hypothetical protein
MPLLEWPPAGSSLWEGNRRWAGLLACHCQAAALRGVCQHTHDNKHACAACVFLLQDALIKGLLELVCTYYRKQAGIEEEEAEVEVRIRPS